MKIKNMKSAGTFALNKKEPIHRWYSYIEGYSSCLIEDIFNELDNVKSVYDPFAGTGTTMLVASNRDISSYYSETNPFMHEVIETKINCVKKLKDNHIGSSNLRLFLNKLINEKFILEHFDSWNGFEKFFDKDVLNNILTIKDLIKHSQLDAESKKIALLALSSIVVQSSNMIRQGDLRCAKENEKSPDDKDVKNNYIKKLQEIVEDLDNDKISLYQYTTGLDADCRNIKEDNLVDCVITSPPYLNGTNYIRNTKLEIKLNDYIRDESDLPKFHSKGIVAGINNVSKRKKIEIANDLVKSYIDKLSPVAYDSRIPLMVAGYFYDMEKVIEKLSHIIKNNGYFIMDIGDSQFAGVHIPTHEILIKLCEQYGFVLYSEDILRERRSKNGMTLSQRLLKFKLNKESNIFMKEAKNFMTKLPYKQPPYSGKNWGDSLHSLCSYHGKLKPSIAHFLIKNFTKEGDYVLDPMCGVGTIPLEACLQNRIGIGNDLSELAYIVSKAKLELPSKEDVLRVLKDLERYIAINISSPEIDKMVETEGNFGLNGKLKDYYHKDTFKELLCARKFFNEKLNNLSASEALCESCVLHILHGNRPYALSRTSHPLTPYSPRGEFIYKNLVEHTKNKIDIVYKNNIINGYKKGYAIFGDFAELNNKNLKVDAIICSPPFADSIKFYMQNWLRLWFCGWNDKDFNIADEKFIDKKQKKNFDVYIPFFDMCSNVLNKNGIVILHLGKTQKIDMAKELSKRISDKFEIVYIGEEDVSMIEKHGIKDKGGTIMHQFLFLQKK